ncbi:MAG: NmrA/HSCARG family protein [Candidatus Rariloculaceae bacterium]
MIHKRTLRNALLSLAVWGLASLGAGQDIDRSARVILVSGATGTQGGAVARELVSRGYTVRGLTRNPDSEASGALTALGVQMMRGDFDDAASLDAALDGACGAFSVQQYRGVGVEGEIRQGKAFADAAERAGVEHFIYTSTFATPLNTGVPQFESKAEIEDHVRSLDTPYSIVRPRAFMSNLEGAREAAENGVYRTPYPADQVSYTIEPADIGRIVAEAFDNPDEWIGRELEIAGDEISNADVAATMSRVLGSPVVYEQIPWAEFVAAATPTVIAQVAWSLENSASEDIDGLRQEFPWLLTVEDYLISADWNE